MNTTAIILIIIILFGIISAIIGGAHERNKKFREDELIRQNEIEKAKEEIKERNKKEK